LRRLSKSRLCAVLLFLLAMVGLFWPTRQLRSDSFVFYFPSNHVLLPLETIDNGKYLPLLQVLNSVGKLGGLQEKKNSLRVWFGPNPIDLRADDTQVRLEKGPLNLARPVRVRSGQWLVPVDFLVTVLPQLTHQTVEYQEGTNRIFLGDVQPESFSVRLDPLPNGARLTIQFTAKLAVHTAASNGKWVLFLGDRPMEPVESSYHFQNPYISGLEFDDQDGLPKLVLTPAGPGLNFFPVQAEGGKIFIADVAKPQSTELPLPGAPPTGELPAPPAAAPTGPGTPAPPSEAPPATESAPLPVVVLDAGHGGPDTGGRSSDGVLEKDLTAQFVARVRAALLGPNKYRIVLTRTGDAEASADQRATVANLAGAVCFISFHASDLGSVARRIAVFSFQPAAPPAPLDPHHPRALIPWSEVQETHLEQSRQLAAALQEQFSHLEGVEADAPSAAPVRGLRNVNAPAVAIEIGRLAADAEAAPLTDPTFQQQVAAAVAQAVASLDKGRS